MRVGIAGVWGFLPDGWTNPWVSLCTGWEWSQVAATTGSSYGSASVNGWAQVGVKGTVNLQAG